MYDFLLDVMETERASSMFEMFMSEEDRAAWYERLDLFFADANVTVRKP